MLRNSLHAKSYTLHPAPYTLQVDAPVHVLRNYDPSNKTETFVQREFMGLLREKLIKDDILQAREWNKMSKLIMPPPRPMGPPPGTAPTYTPYPFDQGPATPDALTPHPPHPPPPTPACPALQPTYSPGSPVPRTDSAASPWDPAGGRQARRSTT